MSERRVQRVAQNVGVCRFQGFTPVEHILQKNGIKDSLVWEESLPGCQDLVNPISVLPKSCVSVILSIFDLVSLQNMIGLYLFMINSLSKFNNQVIYAICILKWKIWILDKFGFLPSSVPVDKFRRTELALYFIITTTPHPQDCSEQTTQGGQNRYESSI